MFTSLGPLTGKATESKTLACCVVLLRCHVRPVRQTRPSTIYLPSEKTSLNQSTISNQRYVVVLIVFVLHMVGGKPCSECEHKTAKNKTLPRKTQKAWFWTYILSVQDPAKAGEVP